MQQRQTPFFQDTPGHNIFTSYVSHLNCHFIVDEYSRNPSTSEQPLTLTVYNPRQHTSNTVDIQYQTPKERERIVGRLRLKIAAMLSRIGYQKAREKAIGDRLKSFKAKFIQLMGALDFLPLELQSLDHEQCRRIAPILDAVDKEFNTMYHDLDTAFRAHTRDPSLDSYFGFGVMKMKHDIRNLEETWE